MKTMILAVVVGVVGYFVSQNALILRHLIVLLSFGQSIPGFKVYEASCDTTPLQTQISTRYTKWAHCFEDGEIRTIYANHNESFMKTELLKAVKSRCPVLINKPFKDDKCYERLVKAADSNREMTVRIKQNIPMLMNNNSVFPTSDWNSLGGTLKANTGALGDLLDEYAVGPSTKYTAFDCSMNGDAYSTIWGIDISFLNGKAGSTFLSNYDIPITTAPMHSAFWDSFGYQCVGHKHWKFLTPEDALPTVRFLTLFAIMKQCDGRKDIEKNVIDIKSPQDTMLYFPPYWAHSVQTSPGLSVLLNYRALAMVDILKDNFMTGVTAITGLVYYGLFHESWDPEEVNYYYFTGKIPVGGGKIDRRKDFRGEKGIADVFSGFLDKLD